jgi:hypothetical protein
MRKAKIFSLRDFRLEKNKKRFSTECKRAKEISFEALEKSAKTVENCSSQAFE